MEDRTKMKQPLAALFISKNKTKNNTIIEGVNECSPLLFYIARPNVLRSIMFYAFCIFAVIHSLLLIESFLYVIMYIVINSTLTIYKH